MYNRYVFIISLSEYVLNELYILHSSTKMSAWQSATLIMRLFLIDCFIVTSFGSSYQIISLAESLGQSTEPSPLFLAIQVQVKRHVKFTNTTVMR